MKFRIFFDIFGWKGCMGKTGKRYVGWMKIMHAKDDDCYLLYERVQPFQHQIRKML